LQHAKRTRDDGRGPLQRSTGDLARAARKVGVPPESFVVMLKRAAIREGLDSRSKWLVDQLVRWGIESYYGVSMGRAMNETLTHARRLNTSELSLVVRQVANDARRAGVPIELVIIELKALYDRLSVATDTTRSGRERMRSREQIISLAINEYYDADRS
jgi:hypothetical protein